MSSVVRCDCTLESSSSTRRRGRLERVLEPVSFRLQPVAELRGLAVGLRLGGLVAALGELLGRLAGPRVELQRAVALDLERPVVDEPPLDLRRRVTEELRLADRRLRQHVAAVRRGLGAEVPVVVVDRRLAVEVEPLVERAVQRLPLLGVVEVGLRVVEAEETRAARNACRRPPSGAAPTSAAHGAAVSRKRTGTPSATAGATALSSAAGSAGTALGAGASTGSGGLGPWRILREGLDLVLRQGPRR